ncbi:hypothetical protein FHR07_24815 [Serratia ureilytica]|nr:hypothetical protein [Serratia ureilytica]
MNQIDPAIIAKKPTTSVAGFFVFIREHPVKSGEEASARTSGEWNRWLRICLPNRAINPLTTQFPRMLRTDSVKKQARESFGNAVGEMIGTVESL